MKKLFYALMIVCVAMMASCQKDPDPSNPDPSNPDPIPGPDPGSTVVTARLSAVFVEGVEYEEQSIDGGATWTVEDTYPINRYLAESYEWNGDRVRNFIVNFGWLNYGFEFQYNDAGQIAKAVMPGEVEVSYTYEGNLATKAIVMQNGVQNSVSDITYTNGKLTKLVMNQTNNRLTVLDFEWTGNNVTKITRLKNGETDVYEMASYDNMDSPYYNQQFLLTYLLYNTGENITCYSKNNITRMTINGNGLATYEYTYNNKNLPVKQESVETTVPKVYGETLMTRSRYVRTRTYEYAE